METTNIIIIVGISCITTVSLFLLRILFLSKCSHCSVCFGLVDVTRKTEQEVQNLDLPVVQIPIPVKIKNIQDDVIEKV